MDLTVYHENNRWHDRGEADIMSFGIDSAVAFQANRASPVMPWEEAFSKIAAKSKQLERSKVCQPLASAGNTTQQPARM